MPRLNNVSPYMRVDLHSLSTAEAKKLLTEKLDSAPQGVLEIEVIHGYHGGTALKNMVRTFKHPRIKSKILSLNQGSTEFILK